MTDILILKGRLLEAETALHQLLIGAKTTSVSYEGKSVSYTQANIDQLRAYIADLKQQIGTIEGSMPRRGPIHFSF